MIIAKAISSHSNLRFGKMPQLVEALGFRLLRITGSHHIYGRPTTPDQLNLQDVDGKAKPYQVRQFLRLVERHNMRIEDTE